MFYAIKIHPTASAFALLRHYRIPGWIVKNPVGIHFFTSRVVEAESMEEARERFLVETHSTFVDTDIPHCPHHVCVNEIRDFGFSLDDIVEDTVWVKSMAELWSLESFCRDPVFALDPLRGSCSHGLQQANSINT